jgi:4-carboxymuconolactone decarboxylase
MDQKIKTIPLPEINTLPPEVQKLLAQLPALNVYKMFANLPATFAPFIQMAHSIFDGTVDSRLLEIVILRVAALNKSEYQWHQHEQIASSIGISKQEIAEIKTESIVSHLSSAENVLCAITDEITKTAQLSDAHFEYLFTHYSQHQGLTIILCISFYNMLSRFLNATRVPIEAVNPLEGKSSPLS